MQRPRTHQSGAIAENRVAGAFLEKGWIVNPITADYGFDLLLQKIEADDHRPTFAFMQVKGTERPLVVEADHQFPFRFEVDHLKFWEGTPIPVYVSVVELKSQRVFVFNAKHGVNALRDRLGDDWDVATTRTIRISTDAEYTEARAAEIAQEVRDYWNGIREMWDVAIQAEAMGQSLYVSWLHGYMTLQHVIVLQLILQAQLADILGSDEEARKLMDDAGLKLVAMP